MSVTRTTSTAVNSMIELLSLPFMQRAMIAGALVGSLASYFGVFIVQRRLSFLGSGLAHAAFGGVALGLLLQTEPLWVAIPFTVVVAVAINWVRDSTILSGDTAVGIFFSVAMALGVVFISWSQNTVDAFAYLFGSILTVTWTDIGLAGALTAVTVALVGRWSRWAYATFDAELAKSDRLSVRSDDYLLSILLAVAIVVSVKIVGILLVAAFLVLPAASARLVAGRFIQMTIIAMTFGVITALAGLLISYYVDVPSGATIILVQAVVFLIASVAGRMRGLAG